MSRDLEHFGDSVDSLFARWGLPNPEVMAVISGEWDTLAGTPWVGRSQPSMIRGSTLVVTASSASSVAFLRYDQQALLGRIAERLGKDVITSVEVVLPGR